MTLQEKYGRTIQWMRLVSANYQVLKYGGAGRRAEGDRRRTIRQLEKWLRLIEDVVKNLKRSAGKSSAKARKDRLVARVIEMAVFEQAGNEKLRLYLTGPRPLNQRYVDKLMEEAIWEILGAAIRGGLLG